MVYPQRYIRQEICPDEQSQLQIRKIKLGQKNLRQLLDLMHNMRKTNNFQCNILLTRWLIISHSTKRMSSLETARVHGENHGKREAGVMM